MQSSFSDLEYAAKKKQKTGVIVFWLRLKLPHRGHPCLMLLLRTIRLAAGEVIRRLVWNGYCGCILCNSALVFRIKARKMLHGVEKRQENIALPVIWQPFQAKALPKTTAGELMEKLEHAKASIRAKVEHPFHAVKNLFMRRGLDGRRMPPLRHTRY